MGLIFNESYLSCYPSAQLRALNQFSIQKGKGNNYGPSCDKEEIQN